MCVDHYVLITVPVDDFGQPDISDALMPRNLQLVVGFLT